MKLTETLQIFRTSYSLCSIYWKESENITGHECGLFLSIPSIPWAAMELLQVQVHALRYTPKGESRLNFQESDKIPIMERIPLVGLYCPIIIVGFMSPL